MVGYREGCMYSIYTIIEICVSIGAALFKYPRRLYNIHYTLLLPLTHSGEVVGRREILPLQYKCVYEGVRGGVRGRDQL